MIRSFVKETRYLSNFYLRPFIWNGKLVPTREHAYQGEKTLDEAVRQRIHEAPTPRDAKTLGGPPEKGGIVAELRPDWSEVCDDIMYQIQKAFYDQHLDLRTLLLMTKQQELVEGNFWHDNYWGDCECRRCQDIPGQNKHGKGLMRLRDEYRQLPTDIPS